jgi:hypothetical protein
VGEGGKSHRLDVEGEASGPQEAKVILFRVTRQVRRRVGSRDHG